MPVLVGIGTSFLTGTGAPAATLGNPGDTYLDATPGVGEFWKKAGAAWVDTGTSLESVIGTISVGAWFATLPTTLPSTPGQPWNDGRTLAFS